MSTKNQKQSGAKDSTEAMNRTTRALVLTAEPTDDELNVLIECAVRDAEIKLAGTPVVAVSPFNENDLKPEEPSEMVH